MMRHSPTDIKTALMLATRCIWGSHWWAERQVKVDGEGASAGEGAGAGGGEGYYEV